MSEVIPVLNPLSYLHFYRRLLEHMKYNPDTTILYHGTGQYDKNWGDQLNRYLLPLLSGKETALIPFFHQKGIGEDVYRVVRKISPRHFDMIEQSTIYSAVGSVLGWLYAENSVVWGSGFLHEGDLLPVEPQEILAVRGPCTADQINEQYGLSVDVFGDPAVLYTLYYWPKITKRYSLGIIPHYVDYDVIKKIYHDRTDICIIDIKSGNKKVIDSLLSCHCVASSSLHGLIMADAYGIPTTWIDWLTPKVDDFKYYDYFESIRCDKDCVSLTNYMSPEDIISVSDKPSHMIDMKNLLHACPFYNSEISPIQL